MGKYELVDRIENCHLFVESQKKAVIEMIKEEIINDDISIKKIIDECLWRLLEIRFDSLSATEQMEITNVIKEMGYDNN